MKLTEHFSIEELCHTDTGLDNNPTKDVLNNLMKLATDVLEPIRVSCGPIKVNCAYRSDVVNKSVGGVLGSEHRTGSAADINPIGVPIESVYDWIIKNISFGQCIMENKKGVRWIHISLPRDNKPNNEALVAKFIDGKMQYNKYEGIT